MNSSINFHLSNTENIFKTFTIPHGSGYLASRSVLSKNGLGLFHSVAPNIGSNNLQASLIFDIKKIVDKDMKLNFLLPADIECETMEVGGKTIYIDPKRRIASIASARGKIGGMMGGMAGGKAGGDRKRRNITEDMVDGSCNKCGRPGKTKRGENGKWSKHIDRVDGKSTYCGQYFPLKKTGVLEND